MSFANVNVGNNANDGSGDPLRNAFQKINLNFANITAGNATTPVHSVAGRTGNIILSVNDVVGAASVSYVNAAVANVSGGGSTVDLESITGNVVPSANVTYNLGSSEFRWKDLYLSGNTIYLGTGSISVGADNKIILPGLSATVGKAESIVTYSGGGGISYTGTPVIIDQSTYYLSNPDHVSERGDFVPAVYAPVMDGSLISDITIVSPGYYTSNIDQWAAFSGDNMWALPEGTPLTWEGIWDAVYQIEYVGNEPYGPIGWGVASTTEVQAATTGDTRINGSQTVAGTTTTVDLVVNNGITFSDTSVQTSANIMLAAFTMANSQHWTEAVSTIGDALNQVAARLYAAGF